MMSNFARLALQKHSSSVIEKQVARADDDDIHGYAEIVHNREVMKSLMKQHECFYMLQKLCKKLKDPSDKEKIAASMQANISLIKERKGELPLKRLYAELIDYITC